MPNIRQPRSGSLQFWPRKRSKRRTARIRTHLENKEIGLDGYAGYKVGMTHVMAIETGKSKKGIEIAIPVTIIECPPIKIASLRLYKKQGVVLRLSKEILLSKEKELSRRINVSKKDFSKEIEKLNPEEYNDVRVLIYTQPKLAGIGKKTPDLVEFSVTGPSIKEKIDFVKSNMNKDILPESVFKEGDYTDVKSITKGKGFQGPIKRFGISIRQRKSEKAIRNPGSLGPWRGQGHIMWRVAHAGKMGYHQRTEYNKQILSLNDPDEINVKGGMLKYGVIKNKVFLIKGGVAGSRKRIVIMHKSTRLKVSRKVPTIEKINMEEKQGN
jgi:large subunit ribosomal protein L3